LFSAVLLLRVVVGFGIFCLLAGGIYIINDLVDRKNDQQHPLMRQRGEKIRSHATGHQPAAGIRAGHKIFAGMPWLCRIDDWLLGLSKKSRDPGSDHYCHGLCVASRGWRCGDRCGRFALAIGLYPVFIVIFGAIQTSA